MAKISDFDLQSVLGRGTFAVVHQARRIKDGELFAIKEIDRKALSEGSCTLAREIDILKKIKHPHIITLHEVIETPYKMFLVMDLVTGGELFDRIAEKGTFTEPEACTVVRQIVDAVNYLHVQGIAHRDLKPENLLLRSKDSLDVSIADFGFSKIVGDTAISMTCCGTPTYVAPEVLQALPYGKEVDMWSVGIITYLLLCGFPPFLSETAAEVFDQIINMQQDYPEEYFSKVSPEAKNFIDGCLQKDAAKRLTAAAALQHPWLNVSFQ